MSKSIYEEMLEIIDRNIFELPTGFAVFYEIRKKIEQALKQAQKMQKLLGLYIDLGNKIEVLDNAQGYGILEFDEIKNICNKIKELENE